MRPEKELLKQEIREKIERFPSFVIMKYAGLTANVANKFRREIGEAGGEVEVVRKRVLLKAAEDAGLSVQDVVLDGHIGLIFFGKDPFESTKMVFKFSQENEKVIQVLGGRYEGKLYNAEDVEALSKLPSKDEMRAQFLSTLEAPMSQTLAVIEALLTSVAHCLEGKCQKESEDAGASEDTSTQGGDAS
jgi:large subunit ribosomal protein L10